MRESVYVVGVCVWVPLEEGAKSLEAVVTGDCDPLKMHTGNRTWLF